MIVIDGFDATAEAVPDVIAVAVAGTVPAVDPYNVVVVLIAIADPLPIGEGILQIEDDRPLAVAEQLDLIAPGGQQSNV